MIYYKVNEAIAGVVAAALLIAASLTLGACDFGGGDSEPEPAAGSTANSAAEPIQLDLLVYNVEYGAAARSA